MGRISHPSSTVVKINNIIQLHGLTTTERGLIPSPKEGMIIFNTTTNKLNFYTGAAWEAVTSA